MRRHQIRKPATAVTCNDQSVESAEIFTLGHEVCRRIAGHRTMLIASQHGFRMFSRNPASGSFAKTQSIESEPPFQTTNCCHLHSFGVWVKFVALLHDTIIFLCSPAAFNLILWCFFATILLMVVNHNPVNDPNPTICGCLNADLTFPKLICHPWGGCDHVKTMRIPVMTRYPG